MKKISIIFFAVLICIMSAGCSVAIVDENPNKQNTEFTLYDENGVEIVLNADISVVKKEPIKVKEGSGDGFRWNEYEYYDVMVKALLLDEEGATGIIKITTTSDNYKTSRGIKVGSTFSELKETYNVELAYTDADYTYYVYDPQDDVGFNRIYFCIENDIVTKIEIENGIDG